MPMERQTMILWVAVNGYIDSLPLESVKAFEEGFYPYIDQNYPDIPHTIADKKDIDDATEAKLKEATLKYKTEFLKK